MATAAQAAVVSGLSQSPTSKPPIGHMRGATQRVSMMQSLQRAGRNLDGAVAPQPEHLLKGHLDCRIDWDLEAEVHRNGEAAKILSELNDTRFAQTVP